jgi:hypothetical protein
MKHIPTADCLLVLLLVVVLVLVLVVLVLVLVLVVLVVVVIAVGGEEGERGGEVDAEGDAVILDVGEILSE